MPGFSYSHSVGNVDNFVEANETNQSYYFSYPCATTDECSPYKIVLPSGIYFLEVWGAQGGQSTGHLGVGGYGGYSSGVYIARRTTTLYLHIGGSSPGSSPSKPGYNGGSISINAWDGPGGGATDFRTSSKNWNEDFDTRIIIAGGGGGAFCDKNGGNGGGLEGNSNPGTDIRSCYGTQTGCEGSIPGSGKKGELGIGGGPGGGAGGGGYYGGGNSNNGGGGGSGYIGGVISYSIFNKTTEESDHQGNGAARITIIGITDFINSKNCYNIGIFIAPSLFFIIIIGS